MALALAQALNCLEPVTTARRASGTPAGRAPSCSQIARGLHPDVLRSSARGQERDRRSPRSGSWFARSATGRSKAARASSSSTTRTSSASDSQDALLKTLEEPPARNVFVLVTSRPNLLSTTVRSRCCVLRFAPLAAAEIAAALVARHGLRRADAEAAAALAGGSFARALGAGAGERAQARAVAAAVLMEAARTPRRPREAGGVGAALLKPARRGRARIRTRKGRAQAPTASRWPGACVRWARCCGTWLC